MPDARVPRAEQSRVLARLLCLAVALPCLSCDSDDNDEKLTAPTSDTESSSDAGATTFDSDATCFEREQGRGPGARYTECLMSCDLWNDDMAGDQAATERRTYEEQSQDPENECFQLRLAFEECIRDYTCGDLEAFQNDRENSDCSAEWVALEPVYIECTLP
jgi:hypothetical protein